MRTVMLYRAGVSVTVPAPERYAVHKLIIATKRRHDGSGIVLKRDKDIQQAGSLIEALTATRRARELSDAWAEAWERGDAWREALTAGRELLTRDANAALASALGE